MSSSNPPMLFPVVVHTIGPFFNHSSLRFLLSRSSGMQVSSLRKVKNKTKQPIKKERRDNDNKLKYHTHQHLALKSCNPREEFLRHCHK